MGHKSIVKGFVCFFLHIFVLKLHCLVKLIAQIVPVVIKLDVCVILAVVFLCVCCTAAAKTSQLCVPSQKVR